MAILPVNMFSNGCFSGLAKTSGQCCISHHLSNEPWRVASVNSELNRSSVALVRMMLIGCQYGGLHALLGAVTLRKKVRPPWLKAARQARQASWIAMTNRASEGSVKGCWAAR